MPRPLTRSQAVENTAFLRHLRRTGNVRLAAREIGVAYSTLQHRRTRHVDFAIRWDVAVATAQARLHAAGGLAAPLRQAAGDPHRTQGGEPVVVRVRHGRLQIRRAHPDRLTRRCEQAFLSALAATANISLSAAAAGASFAAFDRRRKRNPAFAREMQAALTRGYERVEAALLASWSPAAHDDDAWRHNAPPPMPAMTADQALHLLNLHQKAVMFHAVRPDRARRRGEPADAHSARLADLYVAQLARDAEDATLRTVLENRTRNEERLGEPPLALPALDQVTGWSRAGRGPGSDPAAVNRGAMKKGR